MKYIRFLAAILLLPLAFALVYELFVLFLQLGKNADINSIPFWLGLIGYFIFQTIFFKPIKTYVWGHELTHAVVGLLSGAGVQDFNVDANGGSVKLTKTNIWITLSPYFIPLYTVILIFAFWIAGFFWPVEKYYAYFLFFVGFSLSFHFGLTHYALMQGQSDLKVFGSFFSTVFIVLVNCILLSGLLKLLFPNVIGLKSYYYLSFTKTEFIWRYILIGVQHLWLYFRQMK
jgi:hypothetical protein